MIAKYGGYDFRSVRVFIKEQYKKEYDTFQFKIEDFGFNNILDFEYRIYSDRKMSHFDFEQHRKIIYDFDGQIRPDDRRFFIIFLKNTGESYVNEAIQHLLKLDFVKHAEPNAHGIKPGILVK